MDPGRDPGRPFGAPFLAWTIRSDGTVVAGDSTPSLPAELRTASAPATAVIDGTQVRVAGRRVGADYVVVAQAMDQVTDAQRTILLGELLIAPFLLGVVFLGAVVVGRRVAEPIEAARRRQLEFTADASHELRTPLSVIEAHTSLALAQDRDADWYRAAFAKVDRESKRMRRLLEDMLWLARFDAARGRPRVRAGRPRRPGLAGRGALRGGRGDAAPRAWASTSQAEPVVIAAPPSWSTAWSACWSTTPASTRPTGGRWTSTCGSTASGRG